MVNFEFPYCKDVTTQITEIIFPQIFNKENLTLTFGPPHHQDTFGVGNNYYRYTWYFCHQQNFFAICFVSYDDDHDHHWKGHQSTWDGHTTIFAFLPNPSLTPDCNDFANWLYQEIINTL